MKIGYYILQMIVFGISFFLFTSIVEIFPWYEPLAAAAFMLLYVFTFVQVIISILFLLNYVNIVSHINSIILILAIYIGANKPDLFFKTAFVFAIVECILAVAFIVIEIRNFARKEVTQQSFKY